MSKLRASTFFWAFSITRVSRRFSIASPSSTPTRSHHCATRSDSKIRSRSSSRERKNWVEPGIALTAGAPAQLVVDPAALVALRADDVQAAAGHHLAPLREALRVELRERRRIIGVLLAAAALREREELRVSAQHDVGAAAGHVGRDGDGALAAGLGHDLGLALVLLGVQHVVLDAPLVELAREHLGGLDRDRADQHRLPLGVALDDLLDHGVELLAPWS